MLKTICMLTLLIAMVLMGSGGLNFELTPSLDAVWGYTPSLENMRTMIAEHFAYDPALATPELVKMRYDASMQPGFQESYASLLCQPPKRVPSFAGYKAVNSVSAMEDVRLIKLVARFCFYSSLTVAQASWCLTTESWF